jgi:eukaryotic-like serine/threonine-protein kinase
VIGETVASYRIVAKLGRGGMGEVFVAEHPMLGRRAAVKFIRPELSSNPDNLNRFFNEARAASLVQHPGIVDVFDYGILPSGNAFFVMEYLEGETLASRVRNGRLAREQLAPVFDQIADALGAAHGKGIIHRDLKPDNVFLVADRAIPCGLRIKVLDFGIAKLANLSRSVSPMTESGSVLGTPAYMSPEQCSGARHVDFRTDIYSLGCMLYEAASGRLPFPAPGLGEMLAAHLYLTPRPLRSLDPTITPDLERIVERALAKAPEARQQSMAEVQTELAALATVDKAAAPSGTGPTSAVAQPSSTVWSLPPQPRGAVASPASSPSHAVPFAPSAIAPQPTPPPPSAQSRAQPAPAPSSQSPAMPQMTLPSHGVAAAPVQMTPPPPSPAYGVAAARMQMTPPPPSAAYGVAAAPVQMTPPPPSPAYGVAAAPMQMTPPPPSPAYGVAAAPMQMTPPPPSPSYGTPAAPYPQPYGMGPAPQAPPYGVPGAPAPYGAPASYGAAPPYGSPVTTLSAATGSSGRMPGAGGGRRWALALAGVALGAGGVAAVFLLRGGSAPAPAPAPVAVSKPAPARDPAPPARDPAPPARDPSSPPVTPAGAITRPSEPPMAPPVDDDAADDEPAPSRRVRRDPKPRTSSPETTSSRSAEGRQASPPATNPPAGPASPAAPAPAAAPATTGDRSAAEQLYERATARYSARDYSGAIQLTQQLVKDPSASPRDRRNGWLMMGQAYCYLRHRAGAYRAWTELPQADRDDLKTYCQRASITLP